MILIVVLTVIALVSIAAITVAAIALNTKPKSVGVKEVVQVQKPVHQRTSECDTSDEEDMESISAPVMDLPRLPISPRREDDKWT